MAQRKGFLVPLVITLACILGGLILFRFKTPLPNRAPPVQTDALGGTVLQAPQETPPLPDAVSASTLGMNPVARIKSGNNPLWFELGAGSEGPIWIPAPAEASLKPFTPWPLATCITGIVIQDDRLTLAVNREGFLILLPEQDRSIGLYRIADVPYWENYTVGSLFVFEGTPAVLLYRDTFFAEPAGAPPDPPVFVPVKGSARPVGRAVPAFGALLPSDGWEVESLRQGQDGYWYYRGIQRSAAPPQSVYMRSSDLTLPGEAVSAGAFRNSALPEPLDHAPPVLRLVLDAVFDLSGRDRLNV
ncbi:MAG: hypothetical protein LBG24_08630, partial [Treponema sp.]|nr:hypothetical protein [Treponema sp.]